jgi:hypothetical protein
MALTEQLLTHFKEKFGIVTVVNATFYAVDTEIPLISFDTLKMSNITSEGQQKEIRGGQGAELLLQYDFGRTATVEITDALVSMGSLEYLFGGTMSTGTFKARRRTEGVFAAANTIPESAYPGLDAAATGHVVAIVIKAADGRRIKFPAANSTGLDSIALLNAELEQLPAAVGDKFILWYQGSYNTAAEDADGDPAGYREMVLKASDFPPTVRFVGETVVLDADKGKKIGFIVEVPKFKLNANFTLSFDAEGDPSVFDFSGVALSHNGELLKVKTLGFIA